MCASALVIVLIRDFLIFSLFRHGRNCPDPDSETIPIRDRSSSRFFYIPDAPSCIYMYFFFLSRLSRLLIFEFISNYATAEYFHLEYFHLLDVSLFRARRRLRTFPINSLARNRNRTKGNFNSDISREFFPTPDVTSTLFSTLPTIPGR